MATVKSRATKKSTGKIAKKAGNKSGKKAGKKAGKRTPRKPSKPRTLNVDADVLEFIAAIDAYKLENGRPFPSWSEILHILKQLGYRRK